MDPNPAWKASDVSATSRDEAKQKVKTILPLATFNETRPTLDNFALEYIRTALWSSTDDEGEPLDETYGADDIHPDSLDKIIADCERFQRENSADLSDYPEGNAAHDFWLTRCHAGVGFWENDFGTKEQCDRLTKASHKFGECNIIVGDDGKIHFE